MNLSIINGMTPIDEISKDDHVVIDNMVRKVKRIAWNRPCGWYEITFEGERDHEVFYPDAPWFSTIHIVVEL